MSQHTSHFSPQVQRYNGGPSVAPATPRIDVHSASEADIAKRAYEKYQARGYADGFDLEDWTAASHELIAETFGHLSLSSSSNPSLSPTQHASRSL
jgi:hypothetical protein